MSRAVAAAAALALALLAGSARADVFAVAQPVGGVAPPPLVVPSDETPNLPGSLALPPHWTERATAVRVLDEGTLRVLWLRAGAAYGIPWQVLAAINKIESNFGRNMGPSSAGAVGWMQFMPETWLRWGMDATGDGVADPWDPEDAIYSAARYLAAAGARDDLYRGVFAYNHAHWYVRDVLDLAATYEAGGEEVLFELERYQGDLEQARVDVAAASEQLAAAVREERALRRREALLKARAEAAELLSERLELDREAVLAGVEAEAAAARVEELRAALGTAEAALAEATEASRGASFAPTTGALLGAPSFDGDYVFPVGGGPETVRAGRGHHTYPAVDIAAPTGAPVFALTAAVVERSWSTSSGNCGIGATIRASDGRVWTYCHLSYLDPSVQPGAVLAPGAPMGLVGSTGRSTGPHLHLQLQPANAYPQEEAWFQRFAGVAFRWDGEPAPAPVATAPATPHRVFAVVPAAGDEDVVLFTR